MLGLYVKVIAMLCDRLLMGDKGGFGHPQLLWGCNL